LDSGILLYIPLDVGSSDNRGEEGDAAGEEEGEVFANITTTTTTTNAIDSDAAAVTTISPVETGQENATTTATEED
jgi:hypothetical protein